MDFYLYLCTMQTKRNVGVLVMRMQTPTPTAGHLQLMHAVLERSDEVCVILGESPVRLDPKNPMPVKLRRQLVREQFPDFRVLGLHDDEDNDRWSANLDLLIEQVYPAAENAVTLYGSRDSFVPYYAGPNKTEVILFETHTDVSATNIRQRIYDGYYLPGSLPDYAAGFVAGANSGYPTSYQAVDIAYFVRDSTKQGLAQFDIVLGNRYPGGPMRLPGGFTDPSDAGLVDGGSFFECVASRELLEETGIDVPPQHLAFVGSFRVDDWRFRGSAHKIATALTMCITDGGHPDARPQLSADDDLGEVFYANFASVNLEQVTVTHRPLFKVLKEKLERLLDNEFQAVHPDHPLN